MKASSGGNVRIGIVSFITLVSVLLLAVLSVLCVVSANAASTTANRQASSATELYEVDGMGQAILASVDEQLAAAKASGQTASQAAVRIQSNAVSVQTRAIELAGSNAADGLTMSIEVSGTTVKISVSADGGRTLEAAAQINDDLTYTLQSWKTSTTQTTSQTNLWGGVSTTN